MENVKEKTIRISEKLCDIVGIDSMFDKGSQIRELIELELKIQDRDTRHACADDCIGSMEEGCINYLVYKAFHDICVNCRGGIE